MKYQTINAGDHFGRLETLERIKIGRRIAWICKCSCGNTRAVLSQNFTAFIPANLAYKLREVLKWKTGKLSAIYAMKNIQRTPAKALLTGGLM